MISLFVQARMDSSRFPRKMTAELGGTRLVEWVFHRVKLARNIDNICLLTSTRPDNKALVSIASAHGIDHFIGDESDVASRFTEAAKIWPAANYIRVCADNPLICPREIDRLVEFHTAGNFDYSFNHTPMLGNNYADGFGAEIFSSQMMKKIASSSLNLDEREHVTRYFWNHRKDLKFGILPAPTKLSHPNLSFDVDTAEDLDNLSAIVNLIDIKTPGEDIITILQANGKLKFFENSI
jgi:spore coat polysaccharide biosynthesis protein SpsF